MIIHKEQRSIVNLSYHAINKITYNLWALGECCWKLFLKVLRNIKYDYINSFFPKEIMNVRPLCAEHYLLSDTKVILIDLRARNFVHAKTSLHARCVHARHRARNLSSPEGHIFLTIIKIFNTSTHIFYLVFSFKFLYLFFPYSFFASFSSSGKFFCLLFPYLFFLNSPVVKVILSGLFFHDISLLHFAIILV